MAMDALRSEANLNIFDDGIENGDGSWSLTLLHHHPDIKFKRILLALMSRNIVPVPSSIAQSSLYYDKYLERFASSLLSVFELIPQRLNFSSHGNAHMGKETKSIQQFISSRKRLKQNHINKGSISKNGE